MARGVSARDAGKIARKSARLARDIDRAANGSRRPGRPDAQARRTRALIATVLFIALFTIAALDRAGVFSKAPVEFSELSGREVVVERVVDGDTLVLDLLDARTSKPMRVRLWGIDAPELARDGAPAEPFANEARDALASMVEGRSVTILLEPDETRDRYDRVLAHIIANDDSVGAALVERGLAESVERWRHRDTDRFEALELGAQRAKRGIWSVRIP
jgi:endonuclease YncB( thermonuclease family)